MGGLKRAGCYVLKIGSIVWGLCDVPRAVEFWTAALNDRVREDMDKTGAVLLPKSGEGMQLSLKLVTSIKARRHHIDLFSDNMPAEVERLLALGAQRVAWRYPEGLDYTALADPDGNRFCVVQK
jgi:predicted enzyme related to lactoylglutathione lyase